MATVQGREDASQTRAVVGEAVRIWKCQQNGQRSVGWQGRRKRQVVGQGRARVQPDHTGSGAMAKNSDCALCVGKAVEA